MLTYRLSVCQNAPVRSERAAATRDHLLEVGTRLFADRGYEGTSIEAVLQAAGVSRGALYHHFSSKEALFEAAYVAAQARVAREVIEEAMRAGSALETIRAGTRAWLYRVRDPIVRQITLIDAPAVLGWEKWREIDEQHFLGTIKEGIRGAGGESLSAERVDFLAHMLLGMLVEAAMVIARGDQSDEAIEEAAGIVDDFLSRMLGGHD
jgi:AcrR family transcriptional regulator